MNNVSKYITKTFRQDQYVLTSVLEIQASSLLPSRNGFPLLYATDIYFGPSNGSNIPCTSEETILKKVYTVAFEQTTNNTAFMAVSTHLFRILRGRKELRTNKTKSVKEIYFSIKQLFRFGK